MSEMVERVALAIYEARDQWGDLGAKTDAIKAEYEAAARAAIAAMREPTKAMFNAGDSEIPDNSAFSNDAAAVYRAMIDAALADGEH